MSKFWMSRYSKGNTLTYDIYLKLIIIILLINSKQNDLLYLDFITKILLITAVVVARYYSPKWLIGPFPLPRILCAPCAMD
jgi:hypothetical protein